MDKVRLLKVIVITCLIASMLCTVYAFTISVYPGFQNPGVTYRDKDYLDDIKEVDINNTDDIAGVSLVANYLCWRDYIKYWQNNKNVEKVEIEEAHLLDGNPDGYLTVDGKQYNFLLRDKNYTRLCDQDYNTRVKLCSIVQDVAARVSREITLRYIFIISVDLLLIVALVIIARKQKENKTADEKESSNL